MKPISLSVDNGAMFILCDDDKVYRRDSLSGTWELVSEFTPPPVGTWARVGETFDSVAKLVRPKKAPKE